ncbi:MAG: leucine-rich repeat domain-containing protein [Clostridiales bacterium]|nr:leucine-rich repeat domain-containing protein [Clostridiales bacterium]
MEEKRKRRKQHIVVFQDEDNIVLKTTFVSHGEAAVPPALPAKKGETAHHEILFAGWDTDYTRVEDNLVIKAVYKKVPKKYLVIYFHENDKMLGMESVPYGNAAKAEIVPVKESDEEYDYIFIGWNCPLSNISADTNAKAIFEKRRKIFTVRFYHENGLLLKKERVQCKSAAHPPKAPVKKPDATFHYLFDGWNRDTNCILEDMDVQAVFQPFYNEYAISFFDEDSSENGMIWTGKLHYGDHVPYPLIRKKGYDLNWSECPITVDGDYEIYARWTFSNPVGRVITTENGIYEIINSSIHNGSVRCLQYRDESTHVKLPERVLLGDYYYRIEAIGADAFCHCANMHTLFLPDSVKTVEERGLAHCRRLKTVRFGRNFTALGAYAFAEDVRLREVFLAGKRLKKCHKKAFEKLKTVVTIRMKPEYADKGKALLKNASGCLMIVT